MFITNICSFVEEGEITERAVLHCDLNNFFASVACHDNPELCGHPVAVGGSTSDRHGIILAKNELAKKYKVQTGEALWQAKSKCPGLIIIPPDFRRYKYFSEMAKSIYSFYKEALIIPSSPLRGASPPRGSLF